MSDLKAFSSRSPVALKTVVLPREGIRFDSLAFAVRTKAFLLAHSDIGGSAELCLRDSEDPGSISDGCFEVARVLDSSARPGAIETSNSGTVFLVLRGSDDAAMPLRQGFRTDDLLRIEGLTNLPTIRPSVP
jgi:hypothetical protein